MINLTDLGFRGNYLPVSCALNQSITICADSHPMEPWTWRAARDQGLWRRRKRGRGGLGSRSSSPAASSVSARGSLVFFSRRSATLRPSSRAAAHGTARDFHFSAASRARSCSSIWRWNRTAASASLRAGTGAAGQRARGSGRGG